MKGLIGCRCLAAQPLSEILLKVCYHWCDRGLGSVFSQLLRPH